MWRDRRLLDLFGIEHPILQAPMAGTATPALAGAVSAAGGLGGLGLAEAGRDEIRGRVADLRGLTGRSFNLNFFVHPAPMADAETWEQARQRLAPWYGRLGLGPVPAAPGPMAGGFDGGTLELLEELRPKVTSFHFGSPGVAAVRRLQAAGSVVIGSATTVAEARALEAGGFDAVIAQGHEAGGHRGSHRPVGPGEGIGTMALVPQVVDAVRVPVIAAGGIADGRGIAAALMLGAAGVQMGTAFLATPEAATPPARRAALRRALDEDTMVTDAVSGRAARARRSPYAVAMAQGGVPLGLFPALYDLTWPLVQAGVEDVSFDLWGQAAPLTREMPAADLLAALVEETRALLARQGGA